MVDKEIFELINRFENSGLTELSLEVGTRKYRIDTLAYRRHFL